MQKYGLIGYPLGHSFSKNYFNQKFESENIDATYLNFEIPNIKDLKTVLKDNPELNGLNVTIPYKEQVIPYLDDLDEDARLIGAVNVIKFTKGIFGKKLKGYNSDIIGFKRSIEKECYDTFYIQTINDLDLESLGRAECIGITAGASTPNNIIEEVCTNVRKFCRDVRGIN